MVEMWLQESDPFDLIAYLDVQIKWSATVFGDGKRTEGILKHIESEIIEVRDEPEDVEEWVDIVVLALDGAWRAGHSPKQICEAMQKKQIKNLRRKWHVPKSENEPVMHVKSCLEKGVEQ